MQLKYIFGLRNMYLKKKRTVKYISSSVTSDLPH